MHLYGIEAAMLECVDMETGEIIDEEKLNQLSMARDEKIEGIALWIKNLTAAAAALKAEEQSFAERRKVTENKLKSLKSYLTEVLDGQKFETTQVKVSFRKSESLEIEEGAKVPEEFLKYKDPEINKTELKKAVKGGLELEGVQIVQKQNVQIK